MDSISLQLLLFFYTNIGKCSNDSECDEDQACDNLFKVCRKKRPNGGKCGRNAGCISGICVPPNELGICRECRTPGDSCPNGEVCQYRDGTFIPECGPKKSNGQTCSSGGDSICKSGICLTGIGSKYCRACRTPGSTTGCPSGEVCQNAGVTGENICAPQKNIGQTCVSDSICKSGICAGEYPLGFCGECRERGTVDGCMNGEVCQSNAALGENVAANVCGPKKNNGDLSGCVSDESCLSGYCVGMDTGLDFLGYDLSAKYCRECPTAGSSTGCPSGQFCQRLDGREVHVCRPKKQNGNGCSGNDACWSGACVPDDAGVLKYCRVCTNDSHCTKSENHRCFDNIHTLFMKKCCKKVGLKLKECYSKSPTDIEEEIDMDHTVEGYTHSSTGGCSGRNELGSTTGGSVQECANSCNENSQCVSFEYSKSGTTCIRSTTCDDLSLTVQDSNDPYHWYLKAVSISVVSNPVRLHSLSLCRLNCILLLFSHFFYKTRFLLLPLTMAALKEMFETLGITMVRQDIRSVHPSRIQDPKVSKSPMVELDNGFS